MASKKDKNIPKTQFRRLGAGDGSVNGLGAHQRTLSSQSSPISIQSTPQIPQIPRHGFNRSISNAQQPSTSSSPLPELSYEVYSKSRSPSFTSTFSTNSTVAGSRRTPYRVGFQPRGVWRDRMEDFAGEREKHKRDDKDLLSDRRLARRLDKLLELHANHSDAFGLLSDIRLRSSEQNIVKWEDDKDVEWCPIAHVQFNPLKYRKHHCRMCGRVVSAAVVSTDALKRRASFNMVKEDSGRMRACALDEHGIRVCLECWRVVERQEVRITVPKYMHAYDEAIGLEQELDQITRASTFKLKEVMQRTQRMEKLIQAFDEPTGICRAMATRFKGKLGKYMGMVKRQLEAEQAETRQRTEALRATESDDSADKRLQVLFEQQSQLLLQIEGRKEARQLEDLRILYDNLGFVNKLIEEFE